MQIRFAAFATSRGDGARAFRKARFVLRGSAVAPLLLICSQAQSSDWDMFSRPLAAASATSARTVGEMPGTPLDAFALGQSAPALRYLAPATRLHRPGRPSLDWSARGRVGYVLDQTMVYATAGVAGLRAGTRANSYSLISGSAGIPALQLASAGPFLTTAYGPRSLIGWTTGIGVLRRVTRRVSIAAEAKFSEYSARATSLASGTMARAGAVLPPAAGALAGDEGPSARRGSVSAASAVVRLAFSFR